MYEQRFGLNRKPFQSVLTNVDFYESTAYKDLSDSVLHALRSDLGVAVLTGPTGIGKTVTLDSFRRSLDRDGQAMVLRGGNIQTADDLLHSLHRRLIPPPGKQTAKTAPPNAQNLERWDILERMQRIADFWGPTIILLDDAHLAGPEVFAELRSLLEEEADGHRLVRLLIAGPISLEETLAEPAMSDLAQRIRAHEFLQPFTSTESVAYLDHQIARVGGDTKKIFEPKAVERIVAAADGVPRCIDLLADESLIGANKAEASVVELKHVDDALARLRHLPHSWNVSLFSSTEEEPDLTDDETEVAVAQKVKADHDDGRHKAQPVSTNVASLIPAAVTSVAAVATAAGVIEIGGPDSSATPSTQTSQTSRVVSGVRPAAESKPSVSQPVSRVQLTSPGVIEIGAAPNPSVAGQANSERTATTATTKPATVNSDLGTKVPGTVVETADDIGTEVTAAEFIDNASNRGSNTDSGSGTNTTTTLAAAPRKPVDFDRVFGAVTFAGGAVAVTHEVLNEGKLKPNTPQPTSALASAPASTSAEKTGEEVNLEHHMVLAHSADEATDADTASVDAAVQTLEVETSVAVLDNFAEDAAEDDKSTDVETSVSALDAYKPWRPAGSWSATPDSPRRLYQSPGQTNSSPVFDRYTWCELGRAVSSEPARRVITTATNSESVEWPPVVDGVAPDVQIPMLEFDEDYSELLSDLGTLVESTTDTLNEQTEQTPSIANTIEQSSNDTIEHRNSTMEPDQWIDRIDQLIDSDSAEFEVQRDEATETGEDTTTPPSGQRLFTLPIDISDVDLSPPTPFTSTDSKHSPSDSQPGGSRDADAELTLDVHTHHETSGEGELEQLLECGDALQPAVEEEGVEAYAPRLLAQARSKVVTISTAVGGLKKAAGAESLSDSIEENAATPQLELHDSGEDEVETQSSEAGGSFSNLFTRLRQLRKR